jgi:hypothetical protein
MYVPPTEEKHNGVHASNKHTADTYILPIPLNGTIRFGRFPLGEWPRKWKA